MCFVQHIDNATYLTGLPEPTDEDLRKLYAYPTNVESVWLRINFVSSIDGAVSVDGASGGLGTPADKRVFGVLRELADVVLVGSGTARAENYGGADGDDATRRRRVAAGLAPVPPIAVITGSASIDPHSRLFTESTVPPLILTTRNAPADKKKALHTAGARVLELGDDTVESREIVGALATEGLHRVLCEGGPGIFGTLLGDDVVDELCLTTSPVLVGGDAGRIAHSGNGVEAAMRRAHTLVDSDGTVLTRWVRDRRS